MLFALLAFAVIAAAMALNAYLQSRRARSLAGQRAALLSDVGVLQDALLPTVPGNIGELDISVAYRPAQGLAAGGDFFDVFSISSGTTGIIIGDVSGHGRESLIQAALVRYTVRTLMGEEHPLPEVLARADRYLIGELGTGFATVVICCYEHATGELTWAKAGHEPPIIAGEADSDEESATPLGLGLGDTWPQFSRSLAPGERVCLFTDGLTEARRHGQQLGRAHLRSLVEEGLTAQGLVERVQADADECTDDLAAVVISRAIPISALQPPAHAANRDRLGRVHPAIEQVSRLDGSEAVPSQAETAALTASLGERRHRRHHLARDQPRLAGEVVDDLERFGDSLGGVDDDRHDRDVAPQLEHAIAMGGVVAVEAPDSAQARGPARPALAQPAHERHVQRAAAVACLLGGVDHQLLPHGQTLLVGRRHRGRW